MNAVCGLDLYSGKPNPEWSIDNGSENRILAFLDNLTRVPAEDLKNSSALGYRGAYMKSGKNEVYVSLGKVSLYKSDDLISTYSDSGRELEKAIAHSAPSTLDIPWDVVNAGLC
jgi:hypothetical protein